MWLKLAVRIMGAGAITLVAAQVMAVGLGVLEASSTINQPLRVRIAVVELGETSLQDLEVSVAAPEDFARLGVARATNLPAITVERGTDSAGPHVILTTQTPIRAAYVDLVLESRWPSGRLLSQHTILLDPPVFSDETVAVDSQLAADSVQANADVAEQPGLVQALTTVRTDRTSTLYSIAMAARPNASVTVQQTMLAIQRLNPSAFGEGNINRLYAGAVLRLPDLQEIQTLGAQQALAAVRNQNQQNEQSKGSVAAGESVSAASTAANRQDQLSVVVAEPAEPAAGRERLLDRRIAELEAQLAVSQEELARAAREREEFLSRLAAIESQIASAQEIIRLQDEQFTELTRSLDAAVRAQTRAQSPQPAAVTQGGLLALIDANPLVAALGLLVAVSVLVLLLLRRGRPDEEANEDSEVIALAAQEPVSAARVSADAPRVPVAEAPAPAFDPEELKFGAQDAAAPAGRVNNVDEEEAATKLELAYAYHKMGDDSGAAEILAEVIAEGGVKYRDEATRLLESIKPPQGGGS